MTIAKPRPPLSPGETRAYPVRYLAYHHMLNDRIGETALLPNY